MHTASRGFTLIELLVVIAIIGMLSSIVLASLNSARTKSRDARRTADIKQLQTALELYITNSSSGLYPISTWICSNDSSWQSSTLATALDPYMPTLPMDPQNTSGYSYSGAKTYCYYASSYGTSGGWYMLVFGQENNNTALGMADGARACDGTFFDYGGANGNIITVGGSC